MSGKTQSSGMPPYADTQPPPATSDVLTAVAQDPKLATFVQLITRAGVSLATIQTLAAANPCGITIFAPTNPAFSNLGLDPTQLTIAQATDAVYDHVAIGRFTSMTPALCTLSGKRVALNASQGTVSNGNGSAQVQTTIPSVSNTTPVNFHVIGTVLTQNPSTANCQAPSCPTTANGKAPTQGMV